MVVYPGSRPNPRGPEGTRKDRTVKYVAYYRVSTKKQTKAGKSGYSGLSFEAQEQAVRDLITRTGGELVGAYTEVETGKKSDRPQLEMAIQHARTADATLVVAKLDRLARNVEFTGKLTNMQNEGRFRFICCDAPAANELTIHILAAVAADEARRTSQRTKAAMVALKEKGVKLGSARPGHWEGREHLRGWKKAVKAATESRRKRTSNYYEHLLPEIQERRQRGDTMEEIVRAFNDRGLVTQSGKPFTQVTLWRIVKRYIPDSLERADTYHSPASRVKELREQGLTFQQITNTINEEGFRTRRGNLFQVSTVWNIVNAI